MTVQIDAAKNSWQCEVADLAKTAQRLLTARKANLCELRRVTTDLDQRIKKAAPLILAQTSGEKIRRRDVEPFVEAVTQQVLPTLEACKRHLETHAKDERRHARWQKLGFDNNFLNSHPDMVEFLFESTFAYSIVAFNHKIEADTDGHPLLFIEGRMQRWESFKPTVAIDKDYDVLKSTENPEELWTYISTLGFTKQNIYNYTKPFSVHNVTDEEYQKLIEHAGQFYTPDRPDPRPELPKEAVLQICTSLGRVMIESKHPILRAMTRKLASHYSIRIITKDKEVYSIGYRRAYGELAHLRAGTALGQVRGKMGLNDFEELRPHDGRYITSIPISEQDIQTIFKEVEAINHEVNPFDYFDDNCIEKTCRILSRIGINVETKTPLEDCIRDVASAFFKNLPVIGSLIRRVRRCIKAYLKECPTLPMAIKVPLQRVVRVLTFLPRKIFALIKNLFVLKFGWKTASPSIAETRHTHKRKFTKIADYFSETRSDFHYPRRFLSWQKQHKSTHCHRYTGIPKFALLPT